MYVYRISFLTVKVLSVSGLVSRIALLTPEQQVELFGLLKSGLQARGLLPAA